MQKSKKTTNKSKSKTLNKKPKVTVKKSTSTPKKTIAVIGLWHLGLVHTSALAKLGYRLIAIDPDQSIIKELQAGKVRLYEPGMTELLKKYHQLIWLYLLLFNQYKYIAIYWTSLTKKLFVFLF